MQETNFPFICIVIDDASTDGEKAVISDYLLTHFCLDDKDTVKREETKDYVMTYARHRKNNNCYFAVYCLKYNHWRLNKEIEPYYAKWAEKAKYVALCEGDDYWIDSKKMQRQVDFLDKNPNYSSSAENGDVLYVLTKRKKLFNTDSDRDYTIEELLLKRRFPTASVIYRNIYALSDDYKRLPYKFDTMVWCYLTSKGPISYKNIISSVYRRGCGITVSMDRLEWAKTTEKWYCSIIEYFNPAISEPTKQKVEKIIYNHYLAATISGIIGCNYGNIKKGIRKLKTSKSTFCVFLDILFGLTRTGLVELKHIISKYD